MTGMRTGLTGISMAVKASRLLSWMAVIAVLFLMLQPVELGFSHADVLLPTVAVSMAIVAWTVMMVRRVSFQWNIIDAASDMVHVCAVESLVHARGSMLSVSKQGTLLDDAVYGSAHAFHLRKSLCTDD